MEALPPKFGLLTWAVEGVEDPGPWFSRRPGVPSDESGVTIGRGYDMKKRSAAKVVADLTKAGYVDPPGIAKDVPTLKTLSLGAGKAGAVARKYIKDNKLADFEISQEVQRDLFELVYSDYVDDLRRISRKADTQDAYGIVDFATLDSAILDMFSDFIYKGDYTTASRKSLQTFMTTNDLAGLLTYVGDRTHFPATDQSRFDARIKFLTDAIADRTAKGTMPKPNAAVFPLHITTPAKAKSHGHHTKGGHAAHLKHTALVDHRQTRFELAYLRYTSLETA